MAYRVAFVFLNGSVICLSNRRRTFRKNFNCIKTIILQIFPINPNIDKQNSILIANSSVRDLIIVSLKIHKMHAVSS